MIDRRFQVASDISRDGMGVELLDDSGEIIAEIFSSDRDRRVTVSTFGNDIHLRDIECLIRVARERLGAFEDGTPWPDVEAPA